MAGAGLRHGSADACGNDIAVWPYGPAGVNIASVPRGQTAAVVRTYYLMTDPSTDVSELMREDQGGTSVPVADHIVGLRFAYFAGDLTPLDMAAFEDGPWCA